MALEHTGPDTISTAWTVGDNTVGQEQLAPVEETAPALTGAVTTDRTVGQAQHLKVVEDTAAVVASTVATDGAFDQTQAAEISDAAAGVGWQAPTRSPTIGHSHLV